MTSLYWIGAQDANTNSRYISAVAISNEGENFVGNDDCWITGWGASVNGGSGSNNLKELNVAVLPPSQCRRYVVKMGDCHASKE